MVQPKFRRPKPSKGLLKAGSLNFSFFSYRGWICFSFHTYFSFFCIHYSFKQIFKVFYFSIELGCKPELASVFCPFIKLNEHQNDVLSWIKFCPINIYNINHMVTAVKLKKNLFLPAVILPLSSRVVWPPMMIAAFHYPPYSLCLSHYML